VIINPLSSHELIQRTATEQHHSDSDNKCGSSAFISKDNSKDCDIARE